MKDDQLNIKAAQLLEISEKLQRITNELNTLINAPPERVKKLTKSEILIAKLRRT